nr:retrovirus-related Pol polyprotein from transposon TNT 1-94 [Tanacetum cinerariifolium]
MLIFSRAPLFLWAEAIATACFTQNRSIIHCRFNKTPYELINGRKLDISFLHVFDALCYPKNDRKDIGKLGDKGDIGFFIGYSADSCAYRVYNRRTKKIIETITVSFNELSAMAFEQRSSKPGLQSMTSGQINSGLDLTYASSTITTQQPSEGELDLLFEAMYDDYISGQPSATARAVPPAQKPPVRNLKLLINFVWTFMRTVRFGNDHVAVILGFGDLQWGNILITRVYIVKGLGHNLFSVGQFYDSDLEVAFQRNACFVKNLEGVGLLKEDRSTNLYTINLHEMPLHRQSVSCLVLLLQSHGKSKSASHPPKPVPNSRQRLHLLHMDLCGTMRIASINGKRYVLVIVDDYSRYMWVHFLRSKDEAPDNDRDDIGKLGAKGDIGFFIWYSADSCAYRVYNCQTKKIIETMNVSFDELSVIAFEQRSSKPGLQSITSRQISSGPDLTYAPSTITMQQPSEGELYLLLEAMYDDYIGGQPSATVRTVLPAQEPQDVDELNPNVMVDGNTFVNPFANSSTSTVASSSSQNNKLDEEQMLIRNKSRLVVRGYRQEEGIDFEESFASNHFFKGTIDQTLFIRRFQDDILVVQVYVDDIIFGSTHP